MAMKNDTKLQYGLTCRFKIDMRMTHFDSGQNLTHKSQNLHFNGLFLIKVYNV